MPEKNDVDDCGIADLLRSVCLKLIGETAANLEKSGHRAYNHALVSVLSEPIAMQQKVPQLNEVQTAPFWQIKSLQQMTTAEWESLCDGCGKCCLNKLIDEDTEELVFTNVACNLLNTKTCQSAFFKIVVA